MTPINVTQLVLNTLFVWNDYSTAVVLLRDDTSRTLPLAQIIYFGENMTELNLAFAFFMLSMLPILILVSVHTTVYRGRDHVRCSKGISELAKKQIVFDLLFLL